MTKHPQQENPPIRYTDYTGHYTLDAHDMPLPEDLGKFRRSIEARRNRFLARLLNARPGSRVLDAGTGGGWLAEMLARSGCDVVAADLGFDSLRRAQARFERLGVEIDCVLGDVYRLPFAAGSFDAVVISEVVEHLETPAAAFAELSRVLRPGGTIVVSTPYREVIQETLCIHCNKKTPVNAHLHSFDKESMGALLVAAGFAVVRAETLINRPAERMGLAGFTSFLPYCAWRLLDRAACALTGRESFMAVKAVRHD